jgi:formylglycine-generating enzyme required for sulfatase activity
LIRWHILLLKVIFIKSKQHENLNMYRISAHNPLRGMENHKHLKPSIMKTLLIILLLASSSLFANNLVITNVKLTGQDTVADFSLVQFDIGWENSWRNNVGPSNWDAAWVFVKFRLKTSDIWNHATLHWVDGTGSGDGHTEPANTNIASSNDNAAGGAHGVFIYRNANMLQGSVNYTGVQLRWDYGMDGLVDGDSVEICVLGIEMVYVPQGSFYIGSGGSETSHFYTYPDVTNPYLVTSEAAIPIGTVAGNLYYNQDTPFAGDQNGPIPAAYPKGYNAFYMMKYEITQSQYVAFLNKLTPTQASARKYTGSANRYAITGSSPGSYTTTNPYVACNFLKWRDLGAYLDWAALRPMTELEFEKACRGNQPPVPNEYAWGTTYIATSNYTLSNAGAANEGIAVNYSTEGNALITITSFNINGPIRAGIFAANVSNTGRVTAGAGYFGIMELSGNLSETLVSLGKSQGRLYTGLHGDGVIKANGEYNTSDWLPTGIGIRGGNWNGSLGNGQVSDRDWATIGAPNRDSRYGGRGVRLAP